MKIELPGGEDVELLRDSEAGRVVRRRWPVSATATLSVATAQAPPELLRLRLVTENTACSVAAGAALAEVYARHWPGSRPTRPRRRHWSR